MAAVVGFLTISFGIWGIGDIFRGFGVSTVAKVGRTDISIDQFRVRYNEQLQQLGRQMGRPITPDQAQAFANRYTTHGPSGPQFSTPQDNTSEQDLTFNTWQYLASSYGLLVTDEQSVLVPGAVLLCLLALASVAVLVGGRLAENTRRVGLLKAAGGTPGLIEGNSGQVLNQIIGIVTVIVYDAIATFVCINIVRFLVPLRMPDKHLEVGDEIMELDINPLMVLPNGRGVVAVDALVVGRYGAL